MNFPTVPGSVSVDEIVPGLFLGNIEATRNIKFLKTKGIKAVLSITKSPVNIELKNIDHIQFKIDDSPYQDILTLFDVCTAYIDECLKSGKAILVHCDMGISRSSSMVIAYLMKLGDSSYDKAYRFVKSKRSVIDPNIGFVYQLKLYEKMGYVLSGGSPIHRFANNFIFIDKKNQDIMFNVEKYINYVNDLAFKETKKNISIPLKALSYMK